jgi:NAD(P)-dependent dehydrogenase (short-subunit alcohol dehydrogenase family)
MRNQIVRPRDGVAWVTGASSGIGRALALGLAREGWTVAVTARRAEALSELVAAAARLRGGIFAYPADVTDRDAIHDAVTAIEAETGAIALAILNAGIYLPMRAEEFDAAIVKQTFAVNVMGTAHGLEAVIPAMRRRGRGHIAIVSSVAGYGGLPTSAAYGASKAALNNMAEALKVELDRHGIRISLITPGFVETPAQDDNDFPKPFIVSAAYAAKRILRGLAGQQFEITFPRRFTFQLKLLKWLPRDAYIWLVKRQTGWDKPSA